MDTQIEGTGSVSVELSLSPKAAGALSQLATELDMPLSEAITLAVPAYTKFIASVNYLLSKGEEKP